MRKIIIKDFGPLQNIDLNLDKPINIIIGAQASGKSTLAKTICFCKKVRDYLVSYLLDSNNFSIHPNELYSSFLKYVRKLFMGYFGTTKHMSSFVIQYYYNCEKDTYIKFTLDKDGYLKIYLSQDLKSNILTLISEAFNVFTTLKTTSTMSFMERYNEESRLISLYRKHFTEETNSIFYDNSDVIYIPAGRSILSTFSEQLFDVNVTSMDLTMQEFINLIRSTRTKFNVPLSDFVKNYTKTITGQINNSDVQEAMLIISKVLKGNYVCDKDGEKIFFADGKWVKLMFASSGQQESLWILMLMFNYVLENRKAFIILEEPEAHLFPEAQKNIVELISLFCNASNSSVFITTHSPYILTSLNLLLHSYKVENSKKLISEERIIPKICRLNPDSIDCNRLDNNSVSNLCSIMDSESKMINAYEIDGVSEIINAETEKLLALEIKYDL